MIKPNTAIISLDEYNTLRKVSQKYSTLIRNKTWIACKPGYGDEGIIIIPGENKAIEGLKKTIEDQAGFISYIKREKEKVEEERAKIREENNKLKAEIDRLYSHFGPVPINPKKKKFWLI
jgi:hypothetical protein